MKWQLNSEITWRNYTRQVWVEPNSSATGSEMLQLIELRKRKL
jgi:hypothetical protein